MTKRVHFDFNDKPVHVIHEIPKLSETEIEDAWYTYDEYEDFQQSFQYIVLMIDMGKADDIENHSEEHDNTIVGLEKHTSEGSWQRFEHKRDYYDAVLNEQESQWEEQAKQNNKRFIDKSVALDWDKIATASKEVTNKPVAIALNKAAKVENDIQDYLHDSNNNSSSSEQNKLKILQQEDDEITATTVSSVDTVNTIEEEKLHQEATPVFNHSAAAAEEEQQQQQEIEDTVEQHIEEEEEHTEETEHSDALESVEEGDESDTEHEDHMESESCDEDETESSTFSYSERSQEKEVEEQSSPKAAADDTTARGVRRSNSGVQKLKALYSHWDRQNGFLTDNDKALNPNMGIERRRNVPKKASSMIVQSSSKTRSFSTSHLPNTRASVVCLPRRETPHKPEQLLPAKAKEGILSTSVAELAVASKQIDIDVESTNDDKEQEAILPERGHLQDKRSSSMPVASLPKRPSRTVSAGGASTSYLPTKKSTSSNSKPSGIAARIAKYQSAANNNEFKNEFDYFQRKTPKRNPSSRIPLNRMKNRDDGHNLRAMAGAVAVASDTNPPLTSSQQQQQQKVQALAA